MKASKLYRVLSALYLLVFLVQVGKANALDRYDRAYQTCIKLQSKNRMYSAYKCFQKIPKDSIYYPHALAYRVEYKLDRHRDVSPYIPELLKYKDYALVQDVLAQIMRRYYKQDRFEEAYQIAKHVDYLASSSPAFILNTQRKIFLKVGDYKRARKVENILVKEYVYTRPALRILKRKLPNMSDRELERLVGLLIKKRRIRSIDDVALYIRNRNKRNYYMAKQAIMQRNIPLAKKYLARIRPSSYYYGKALYEIAKKDRYSKRYSYIIALGRLGHTRFQSKLALSMLKSKFRYALRLRGSRRYKKFREMEYLAQYIRHRDYIGEKYWYLGLKEYLSDDPETAARYFVKSAKALERSRSSDKDPSKAYYWLFVTYKSLDKDLAKYYLYKAASFDNPESFYALRAKKLINVKKTLLDVKQPLPRVKLSKADKKLFLIVRLKHIGAYVDAYREARYHFNKADRLPHKLALLEKFKLHKVFPEITARSFYRKYKENKKVYKSYLGYSYPKPFEYITKEDLVYAIMRQESFFNTYAVSRAGARGLMQIMPRTGRWISRRLGVRNFKVSDLFIPEVNIRFGRFYIHYLLRKYRGNLIYAIAAYNAGYGNVNKFLKRYSITDPAEFVEFFPLSETRDYVKKVYINYIFYSE